MEYEEKFEVESENCVKGFGGYGWLSSDHGHGCDDHLVNRWEMDITRYFENKVQDQALVIAKLEAEKYSDAKDIELYKAIRKEFDKKLDRLDNAVNAQAVYNATNSSVVCNIEKQVRELEGLTRTYIPARFITPEPMARYNTWIPPVAENATAETTPNA